MSKTSKAQKALLAELSKAAYVLSISSYFKGRDAYQFNWGYRAGLVKACEVMGIDEEEIEQACRYGVNPYFTSAIVKGVVHNIVRVPTNQTSELTMEAARKYLVVIDTSDSTAVSFSDYGARVWWEAFSVAANI